MDGEPKVFEWKIFQGHAKLQLLGEIRRMMEERNYEPEQFKYRITFKSMCNDIEWDKKGNKATFTANAESVSQYATIFPEGCWSFLGPGCQQKRYGTHTFKPEGEWNLRR